VTHPLSSFALRRERALTRKRASASLPSSHCDCEDPGPRAAPAAPLKDPFTSECLRPPQGARSFLSEHPNKGRLCSKPADIRARLTLPTERGSEGAVADGSGSALSPPRWVRQPRGSAVLTEYEYTPREKLFARPLRTHEGRESGRPNKGLRSKTEMHQGSHQHSRPRVRYW
jgi:hypothetical protein